MSPHRDIGRRRSGRRVLLVALATALAGPAAAEVGTPTDGVVKMALVYNMGQFVDWPASAPSAATAVLCVVGRADHLNDGLAAIEGRPVHGHPLHVQRIARVGGELDGCEMAYFAEPLTGAQARVLATAHQHGILTFSDDAAFLDQGGIVMLETRDNHVRFAVNLGVARSAGFSISSKVLRLAERVVGAAGQ